jgi:hypothetical protein
MTTVPLRSTQVVSLFALSTHRKNTRIAVPFLANAPQTQCLARITYGAPPLARGAALDYIFGNNN